MSEYSNEVIDEIILALLFFNSFEDNYGKRAWKSLNWDSLNRLHEKEYISDPKKKAKSVIISDEALKLGKKFAENYFHV